VWETPAFRFRSIERILSGWQITPVLSVRSGMPMDIRNPYDSTLAGNDDQPQGAIGGTAEMIGPFRKLDPRSENTFRLPNGSISTAHFLFDPTSFKILSPAGPEQARMGNLGRNVFTGPGVNNLDLSVLRRIALGESQKLELRVDSTNVLNHAQFLASRAGTFNTRNGFFGVTDRTTGSRRFQFVIKLLL
jgi:hypothetical protein